MLKLKNTVDTSYLQYLQDGTKVHIVDISLCSLITFFGLLNPNYCGYFELN